MRPGFLMVPLVGLALCAPAAAQGPDAKSGAAANAAIRYWQAFGLMPALDKDQAMLLHEWDKVPLDAAARKLIDQSRNSLQYLHRGAKLPHCDWALDYDDGIRLLLPHAAKARTLAQLAALRARSEFETGDAKAGVADVIAMLRLAGHVQTDPIMIDQLVGYAIEGIAVQAAAPHLPAAKPALGDLAAALDRLPARTPMARTLELENQSFVGWMIRELKAVEKAKPGSWQGLWKEVLAAPGEGPASEAATTVTSYDEALKLTEGLLPMYAELGKLTALPPKEFDARYPEFMKKAEAANRLARDVLPAVDKVMASRRRADARLALLRAATAVVQDGPDRLKDFKDPFGDGPFDYTATDGGFELKSKLIFKDQPVTLAVGTK
jgi:hypothetical protein